MNNDSHHLSDEFIYQIGYIAIQWSALERQLEFAVLEAQRIPFETGLVVTAELGFRGTMNLIRTALNWKTENHPPKDEEAHELLNKIEDAYGKRNAAVHSVWAGTADANVATRSSIRAKGRLKLEAAPIKIDSLVADGEEIRQLASTFHLFRQAKRFLAEDSNQNTP